MEKASAVLGPRVDRSKFAAPQTFKGLKFISKGAKGWDAIEERFDKFSQNGLLHRADFGQCIGMEEEFAIELLDALARRMNISRSSISKAELLECLDQIFDNSLQTFLDMVDKNADGRITELELKEIISLSASTNCMFDIKRGAEEYARQIMDELDPSNKGYIELEDMETLLLQALNQSVVQIQPHNSLLSAAESHPLRRWCRRAHYFLEDNWRRACMMMLWLSVCLGLFAWKFLQYRRRRDVFEVMGYCICVAKGSAETLKLNMALVLFPVCRNTVTWIRTHSDAVARAVPFDDNVNLHKVVAGGIAVGAGLHVVSHLTCGFPRLLHATDAQYYYLGFPRPESYWWFVKGTEGWTGLVMLVLMAVAFTLALPWLRRRRRGGRLWLPGFLMGFNAFWYSHLCFVLVYALLLVHGHFLYLTRHEWYDESTWMYLAVPMVLYACERLVRLLRSTVLRVMLLKVAVYPRNVLWLHFTKPVGFQYTSGQYIFVNCPDISRFQWHPCCITSDPQDDYVSVHIRTLADWAQELKNIFSRMCQQQTEYKGKLVSMQDSIPDIIRFPKLLIEGPYGLTLQDYKQYDIVLLISLGIGAAVMTNIIRDIISNIKDKLESDNDSGDTSGSVSSPFHTRRAYFCWITREEEFDWFRLVIDDVVKKDKHGAIEFHNYCTTLHEKGDARSAVIAALQSLNYAKIGIDIISGTCVKAHFGKPNWYNVYKHIALNHPNQRIGVFYCGGTSQANVLRELAQDFSRKTTTKFEFHKEYF